MNLAELKAQGMAGEAVILGCPGNYHVRIGGQLLGSKRHQHRRFTTADAAVNILLKCGIRGARLLLDEE